MPISLRARESLSDSAVARAEAELGLPLPADYRAFLLATDGGTPIEFQFSAVVGVREFLRLQDALDHRDRLRGGMPESMLPIADDGVGNLIVISLTDGAVYFWNHEINDGTDDPGDRISASFMDFVEHLRTPDPLDLSQHSELSVAIHDPQAFAELKRQVEEELGKPTMRWPPP
jgi:cell wall assembly regulator SMI1